MPPFQSDFKSEVALTNLLSEVNKQNKKNLKGMEKVNVSYFKGKSKKFFNRSII